MFLKVVLFWFQGCGRSYKGGMLNVSTNSKPLILGLSNEVLFVSELSLKGGQTTQNTFPQFCCTKIPVHQCILSFETRLNLDFFSSNSRHFTQMTWSTLLRIFLKNGRGEKLPYMFQTRPPWWSVQHVCYDCPWRTFSNYP